MFKTGVIGIGSMGRNHARVYGEISELVGVCDLDQAAGKALAKRFDTRYFEDYREFLKGDVEAVTVATPTAHHHPVVMEALAAGKHVLVEKPISSTIEQAGEMVRAAKERGLTLATGHIERHNPVVKFSKEALNEERFGDVITISSRRVSSLPQRIKDVGVIFDLGIHDIDVMRYLIGSPVTGVYTLAGKRNGGEFETFAQIGLDFGNGVSGIVEVNWLTPMKVRKMWLTCSKDYVELDYMRQTIQVSSSMFMNYDSDDLFHLPIEYDVRNVSLKRQEPLKIELQDFLDAIAERRQPLITGQEGLENLRVAKAAIASYKEKRRVEI